MDIEIEQIPNPNILASARAFHGASKSIKESGAVNASTPAIVNSAFALELYLKSFNSKLYFKDGIESLSGKIIYDEWQKGSSLLLEGAQGSLLDIDFGTYPFVTSSNPVSGGATCGSGLPPTAIDEVTGVMKTYVTRVGEGPFPSEDIEEIGEKLRIEGNEYGATTGRPRRCGWFDAIAAQYSVRINGLTSLALTKLDVLDKFDQIKICTSYEYDGRKISDFPASLDVLSKCKPVFESYQGWNVNISEITKFSDLPLNTIKYIQAIEKYCGIPAKYVSVGVNRRQIIQQ
jgi:adenylosuccinate synthase